MVYYLHKAGSLRNISLLPKKTFLLTPTNPTCCDSYRTFSRQL